MYLTICRKYLTNPFIVYIMDPHTKKPSPYNRYGYAKNFDKISTSIVMLYIRPIAI